MENATAHKTQQSTCNMALQGGKTSYISDGTFYTDCIALKNSRINLEIRN